MNNIFSKIIEFILNVFAYKDKKETDLEEKPIIDTNIPKEEEKAPEVVEIKPNEVIDKPKEEPQPPKVEEPKTLTLKEQQTYLKKLGLYTKKIDGIRGAGHKKAVKQFNTIFLNKESEVYHNDTDKLLREIYTSYNNSPYMVNSD